ERRSFVLGQTQRVVRTKRANFERRDREVEIIDWTGWRREVKDVTDLLFRQKNEIRDIMFDEPEIFVAREMSNVRRAASDYVDDDEAAMTFRQKPIPQMRAEKTRAAGDNRNELGTFGHCGCVLIVAGDVYQQEVRHGGITNNCRAFDSFAPAPSPVRDARL